MREAFLVVFSTVYMALIIAFLLPPYTLTFCIIYVIILSGNSYCCLEHNKAVSEAHNDVRLEIRGNGCGPNKKHTISKTQFVL